MRLTNNAIEQAAKLLAVDTAAIRAVADVESTGEGFLPDGRPKILFEGHVFWAQLKKRGINPAPLQQSYPGIIYPAWTKAHYKGGIWEYDRLNKAKTIHTEAALCSASYGAYQIMGFNYKLCGCASVGDMVSKMTGSDDRQLDLFVRFVKSSGLDKWLRAHNWAEFARRYNGPGYAQNKYDVKLKQAYDKYVKA